MANFCFKLILTIRAPVLSQAVGAKRWRLDTAAFKTNDEKTALPGTLIRGNLKETWKYFNEHFNQQIEIEKWFGEKSNNNKDDPNRGLLQFDDLWIANKPDNSDKQRYRIQHNPETGTVKEVALQVIESPFDSGEKIEFIGNIVVNQISQQEANDLKKWLKKGFEFVPAVGAFKGVGFGKIIKVECVCNEILIKPKKYDLTKDRFGIRMKLDRPFCFAKHRSGDNDGETNNTFYSEEFISGGVIKGAIAEKLEGFPLEKIHITHALPVEENKDQRPIAIPLSWVINPKEKEQFYDISHKEKAGLINQTAPTFQADWKYETWKKAKEIAGWVDLSHTLRMHTAIDPEKRTSEDGQLFAMDCVEVEQREWLANITFDKSISNDQKKQFLETLGSCLDNLGKTKARATIEIGDPFKFKGEQKELKSPYVVVLQSAARLLPHEYLDKEKDLKEIYNQVWQEISGNSLKLINFFAQQQLSGGQYIYRRFQQNEPYNPEILTLAGSVFVLKAINEEKATKLLEEWQIWGLPIHDKILYQDDWSKTPYTRNNGYGEIVVNGCVSEVKKPAQEEWLEIEEN
ncbi:MAG: hypothetical protein RIT27_1014 [Pseudomonadota bacterium]|jgi:hypothetical protein